MEREAIIKEKLEYYLNSNVKVHITKFNKEFLNGFIYAAAGQVYLLKEDFLGNIKVFINEIYDIEEFVKKP